MKLLELNKISDNGVKSLQPSFNNLPETSHKDGKYRLRRYSTVELRTTFWNARTEIEINRLSHGDFTQSSEFNKFQGGMARNFEEIEEDVLQSDGMKEACLLFKECNNLDDGQEVEIHQIRIATLDEGTTVTPVSPEGVHQDGFDHIAMIGINRYSILGGELLVYSSRDAEPFMVYKLGNGDVAMLDDSKLWHNAKDIIRIGTNKRNEKRLWPPASCCSQGYMDLFVFCAKTK